MALINVLNVECAFGGPPLLHQVSIGFDAGERICIVGRNGAGKSTLLKLIAGEIKPDEGEVRLAGGARVARLHQEVPHDWHGRIVDVVLAGLGEQGQWLAEYHELLHAHSHDEKRINELHACIDAAKAWALDHRVERLLDRLQLPGEALFEAQSGGMKRRVLMARALVAEPDVLLLDEPTNHLDIEAIAAMEESLKLFAGCLIFVTHDRAFLRALATRIVEIDRGEVTDWPGDYDNYLRRREERLHAEAQENARFDKLLAQEEVWIRQGIKARRTRNEGRVTALKKMRREYAERRNLQGQVKLTGQASTPSGKRVVEARNIDFAWGEQVIVRDFSTVIQRGDKIGILGPNGSGKTTLIQLLLGQLQPQAGEVLQGTQLDIAVFDQYRVQLREDWNAMENVADGGDTVVLNGVRTHVLGYLQNFLFTPDRARAPITKLSGGERNRLLLAKLLAKPSNLLVMDEPTNDLDVETLDLLEEWLQAYAGTLILVSHDRDFIDNVVTHTLVMESDGVIGEYAGGYSDWLLQRAPAAREDGTAKSSAGANSSQPKANEVERGPVNPTSEPAGNKRRLSYKDQRELETLPAKIEALESEIESLLAQSQDPAFYKQASDSITAHNQKIAGLQNQLQAAYQRWEALEG